MLIQRKIVVIFNACTCSDFLSSSVGMVLLFFSLCNWEAPITRFSCSYFCFWDTLGAVLVLSGVFCTYFKLGVFFGIVSCNFLSAHLRFFVPRRWIKNILLIHLWMAIHSLLINLSLIQLFFKFPSKSKKRVVFLLYSLSNNSGSTKCILPLGKVLDSFCLWIPVSALEHLFFWN